MIKESDNSIQEIFNQIVLVEKIGEDKVKVHIYVYMKKLKKEQLYSSLTLKNRKIMLLVSLG